MAECQAEDTILQLFTPCVSRKIGGEHITFPVCVCPDRSGHARFLLFIPLARPALYVICEDVHPIFLQ